MLQAVMLFMVNPLHVMHSRAQEVISCELNNGFQEVFSDYIWLADISHEQLF